MVSNGVKTNRDAWTYNFTSQALAANVEKTIAFYNSEVDRWRRSKRDVKQLDSFVAYQDDRISWSRDLKVDLTRLKLAEFRQDSIRRAVYRPFTKQFLYFDRLLNEEVYRIPSIFPATAETENKAIVATIDTQIDFSVAMVACIPCIHLGGRPSQTFPFYTYAEDGSNRRENISDWALNEFRTRYSDPNITKWDIFHYVYAVLHHPEYRQRYAANLKRELPRVPYMPDFRAFAEAGQRLAGLHVNYEQQPEYPLERIEQGQLNWRVEKMRLNKDKVTLVYNEFLTLKGIPPETYEYRLGNRSALEWVIDQYQVSTDSRSGITNDPNRVDDPEYVVRLIGQVIAVSLETTKIVNALPVLECSAAATSSEHD